MATNKIVILENSVELYEHYINDLKWERTLSFKRGGVTYLISNGTIKFYAYIDYLYRNCIMSMQLPLWIVDEKRGIDGEYSDIDEIIEVLDPIFPSNDISAELEYYLTKVEAAETYLTKASADTLYQPIGDYVTDEELVEALDDYYTKDEADEKFQEKLIAGDNIIISGNVISAVGGSGGTGCNCDLSDYVTFEDMADYVGDVYTKTEVNNLFVTKATFNTYITNLQQQINSLVEAISGCCGSSGETEYRWITMTNDYACSGTTKMTKEKQQSSTDGGMTWTDTGQYRTGSTVLEYNSVDCGYAPSSNYKVRVTYKKGMYSPVESGQVECNSSTTLTNDELREQITFPAYFKTIEFGGCIDTIGEDAFLSARELSAVTVTSNIKTLDSCAFANCSTSSYTLNEGLVTIGTTAFINNDNLTAITIPNSVTTIGGSAFSNCANLRTVTIGSGITSISGGAFAVASSDNVKITSLTINATTPPTIDGSASTFIGNYPIYVPAQSVDAYKAAQYWSYLWADRIQAIP